MKEMPTTPASVLCWPRRVLSADDLRRHLTSQREVLLLPRTIVTPLAADELRAKGVRIHWQAAPDPSSAVLPTDRWFYAQDRTHAIVAAAIQALEREGIYLTLQEGTVRALAESLSSGYTGGVILSSDVASAVCIANKVAGVRAASVCTVHQAARAKKSLGANFFAVDVPGPTFFEVRQILKTIVTGPARCPDEIAKTLQELDGHAHR